MSTFLYPIYTLLHLILLVWGIFLCKRTRFTSTLITLAVTFGLVYDNLILSLGIVLKASPFLYQVSIPRFVLHQLFLPWIILATFEQVHTAGHDWAKSSPARWMAIILSLAIMTLGIITRLAPMDLQPVAMDGINRYVDEGAAGPPVVSIVAIGYAAVMGALLWWKNGWPWLFITAIMVFVGEGIPVEIIRRIVGSGGEVLFILAMLKTDQWLLSGKNSPGEQKCS